MKITLKRKFLLALGTAILSGPLLVSCSDDDPVPTSPVAEAGEYAIIFSTAQGRYMLPAASLTEGSISPIGSGVDISDIFSWGENIIQKGKDFYHLHPNDGKFGKYVFENGSLTTVAEIPFTAFASPYLGWHVWIDEEQLMFGPRSSNFYAIVNTTSMTLVKSGEFESTGVPADHRRMVFSAIPKGSKLLIGYGLYNEKEEVHYDSSYMAVIDFPSLTNLQVTSKDGRSAPIGALRNGYFSQFSEAGNTYILTHPIALGANKPNMPTGFFRVKDGSFEIDPGYFFNVSAITGGDKQLGVTYIGNGKAILINAHDAATNVKEWDDWWYAAMWEYLIVDVNTQQVVKKLDFPPLMNSSSAVIHDGKAYIAVNDPNADAVYIWEYDPEADTLTKGLKIVGGSDDTPSLFKLN
ncbi:hypothetical protein J2X69_001900 [Algoriphagus sp. 4150]|uniref:DUF4374 domain-containing protein n=1 Tax=Algoriphagus sp. 4150 TaxID=2817756 RepID=UPI00285C93A3|nr:DUF4374 domain-containing protein [Algoriphagus sp. 4150]MDR7129555.1 hypothetical protein [Algoriphagus sp. 4150]